MYMRRLLLSVFVLLMGFSAYSQQADSKLYDVYTMEQIDNFRAKNPKAIDNMNFYVNNVYYIIDAPSKSIESQELKRVDFKTGAILSDEITAFDLEDFNPYLYNCKPANDKKTYYTVGNTGKLVVMRSTQEMAAKYQQYQKRQ